MASRIYPMGLIFSSILILCIPGVFYNNFSSSGLNPAFALGCGGPYLPGQAPDFTCHNTNASGCQLDPSSCSLSGTTVSFLNQQSPFTDLIRGDYTGVLPYLTGNLNGFQPSKSMWQVTPFGSSNLYNGECVIKYNSNSSGPYGYIFTSCFQTNSLGVIATSTAGIVPARQAFRLSPVPGSTNTTSIPFYNMYVYNFSTWAYTSSYLQATTCKSMIGFFFQGTNTNTLAGCQYYYPHSGEPTTYYYYAIDYNVTSAIATLPVQGATRSIEYCEAHASLNATQCPPIDFPVVIQPENWDVFDCDQMINFPQGSTSHEDLGTGGQHIYNPFAVGSITPQCGAVVQAINNFKTNANASGILGSVLLWLVSIFLFLAATGFNFQATGSIFGTGVGTAAGVNRQGTKFAQVLGLSLVAFVPLYSEFATWFTSGILPNGFDGSLGIVSILLTAMLFAGVFWQATLA